jgi:hypothetical protein
MASRLRDALAVHVAAVAAAEIHQPVLLLALGLDHRMSARNCVVVQRNLVGLGAP